MKNLLPTHPAAKQLTILLIVVLIAGAALVSYLFYQIQNRYEIGVRAGARKRDVEIARFMDSYLKGNKRMLLSPASSIAISPIEINGVKTFEILGLE